MQSPEPVDPRPVLTTLAFPSETDSLFVLLMLAALMLPINIGVYVYTLNRFGDSGVSLLSQKLNMGRHDFSLQEAAERHAESVEAFGVICDIAAFPAAVLVITLAVYLNHPRRLRRRKRLRKADILGKEKLLSESINRLAAVAGVRPTPIIEIADQQTKSNAAQVFGVGSRLSIMLSMGLCIDHLRHGPRFTPVVSHELGHIANCDIGKTYFAEAVWHAFILVTVSAWIAVVMVMIVHQGLSSASKVVGLVGVGLEGWTTVLAVQAIRAKLLRAREYGADARAVTMGAGAALCAQLRQVPPPIPKWPRFRRYWQLHPTAPQRLEAVENPHRQFLVDNRLSLVVGFLLPSITPGLFCLLMLWADSSVNETMAICMSGFSKMPEGSAPMTGDRQVAGFFWVSMFIFGAFIALAPVGLAVLWVVYRVAQIYTLATFRGVTARLAFGDHNTARYRHLWFDAMRFTLGLILGYAFIPLSNVGRPSSDSSIELIILAPIFVLSIGCCLSYLRFFSHVIVKRHVGSQFPLAKFRLLTLGACLQLVGVPGVFLMTHVPNLASQSSKGAAVLSDGGVVLSFLEYPIIFLLTFVGLRVARLRQLRCPCCLAKQSDSQAFGKDCLSCGAPLAAWPTIIDSYIPGRSRNEPFNIGTQVEPRSKSDRARPSTVSPPPPPVGRLLPIVCVQRGRKIAITSLCLGILGLLTSCIWPISFPLSFLAIVLGHFAARRSKEGIASGKKTAVLGYICGYLSFPLAAFCLFLMWYGQTAQLVKLNMHLAGSK